MVSLSEPKSIAIDGPVASGKTAVGKLLAQRLGYRFLDTGAMYRAVTWAAIEGGIALGDEEALASLAASLNIDPFSYDSDDRVVVDGEEITERLREPEVEQGVSIVARVPGVRSALVNRQRALSLVGPTVMVGRDIGTVVLPKAGVKVFLKAPVAVRAKRRYRELKDAGRTPDYDGLVDDLVRRDKIDTERADSPLQPAADAFQIDTANLGVREVTEKIVSIVEGAEW